jgi:hypothetical protein
VTKTFSHAMAESTYGNSMVYYTIALFACQDDEPPKYKATSGKLELKKILLIRIGLHSLCRITVDLKKFPKNVWRKGSGPRGDYHRVDFEVSIVFKSAISFILSANGVPMGKANVSYE